MTENQQVARIRAAIISALSGDVWEPYDNVIDYDLLMHTVAPRILLELEAAESWGRAQAERDVYEKFSHPAYNGSQHWDSDTEPPPEWIRTAAANAARGKHAHR